MGDMILKQCPYDSTAAAYALFDTGSCVQDYSNITKITRHMRIKIFKKKAIDSWSTIKVKLSKRDRIRVKAITYNLQDGKITKWLTEDSLIHKVSSTSATMSIL